MTLDEAIKILAAIQGDLDIDNEQDDIDALKLGIEALKRLQSIRDRDSKGGIIPLPGETKD